MSTWPEDPQGTGRDRVTFAVILAQLALVALVYGPSLRAAFVSDAWVYLATLRKGAWYTISRPQGYHWQPVASAWIALIRAVCGERAIAFQIVNLAQLAAFAFLAYLLGRRLLFGARTSLLASLLIIASAAHFEASYWPLAGNMHLLAAQFYLVSLIVAHDVASGRLLRVGPWLLALALLAAVFSHPAMTTAIPVCALVLVLVRGRHDPGGGASWRSAAKLAWPLALVAALFLLVRMVTAARLHDVPKPGFDPDRFYWLSARGLAGLFSMRGSFEAFVPLMTLGSEVRWPDRRIWLFVGGWMLAAGIVGALCWWRARTPGVRVLLALLAIHLLALTVASGGITSRQTQILAVPAALLTVSVIGAMAERISRRWGIVPAGLVASAPLALLLTGAYRDHRVAARLCAQSGNASRAVVAHIRERTGPGKEVGTVTLVNMPANLYEKGIPVFAFHNGLPDLVRLASRSTAVADLRRFPFDGAPADVTQGSLPIERDELKARTVSPQHLVLLFEAKPFGIRVLDATSP